MARTRFAIQCAQEAEKAGAHGVLLLPHYLTEAGAGRPGRARGGGLQEREVRRDRLQPRRCRLQPATLAKLADRCPNLIGFKDGIGDIELMVAIHRRMGDRFAYLGGLPTAEVYAAAYKALGMPVYSSAVFNFIPKTAMEFYEAVRKRRPATQHRLLDDFFLPYLEIRNRGAGLRREHREGRCHARQAMTPDPVRPPLTDLKPEEMDQLASLISALGPQ